MIPHHRFREQYETECLPRAAEWPVEPANFFWYPVAWLPGLTQKQRMAQQGIYQLAFEQARAVARLSLPERDLLGTWN